jgi:hypothetical protein
MALSTCDDDTIDDVSMAAPEPELRREDPFSVFHFWGFSELFAIL